MLSTLATIAPVFLMIAAGYFARKLDIMPEGSGALLTRVVTWIALPALMLVSAISRSTVASGTSSFSSIASASSTRGPRSLMMR